jgi:hypothetical protein
VEKRLKKYETNPGYKMFIDYAKGRLAQCDSDLKQYDVLDPKRIRDNLKKLENILYKARQDEVDEKKNEILAAINDRKKERVDQLNLRMDQLKDRLSDMPKTLAFAKKLHGEMVIKTNMIFNDRSKRLNDSIVKMMGGSADVNQMADAALLYLDSYQDGLFSDAQDSANDEAMDLYKDFDDQVTGEYVIDMAKEGDLKRQITLVCASYLLEDGKDGEKHVYNEAFRKELSVLKGEYIGHLDDCKGDQSYKKAALVYGDFLNQFNELCDKHFPDEVVPGTVNTDYYNAALVRTNKTRLSSEKGWDDLKEATAVIPAMHIPASEGVANTGLSLHVGPENEDLAGVVFDMVRAGSKVKVQEGQPLTVNGDEYVQIQVLDDKGVVTNEGWVLRKGLNIKYGEKQKKGSDNKGAITA